MPKLHTVLDVDWRGVFGAAPSIGGESPPAPSPSTATKGRVQWDPGADGPRLPLRVRRPARRPERHHHRALRPPPDRALPAGGRPRRRTEGGREDQLL